VAGRRVLVLGRLIFLRLVLTLTTTLPSGSSLVGQNFAMPQSNASSAINDINFFILSPYISKYDTRLCDSIDTNLSF
jgi:hypothetical protein